MLFSYKLTVWSNKIIFKMRCRCQPVVILNAYSQKHNFWHQARYTRNAKTLTNVGNNNWTAKYFYNFTKPLCTVNNPNNLKTNATESSKAPSTAGFSLKFDQTRTKLRETTEKFKETKEKFKETKEKFEEVIMKENIFTVPNGLCVTRIVLSPVLAYLILCNNYEYALGLFIVAGITDLLDGYIARNFKNQQSMFGSFLDPMADKFLVFCLFLSLTYSDMIPVSLTCLIVARDVCLFGAGFYIRYLSLPPPKTLWRYFDATHATAQLSPTFISKVNTVVQLFLVACTLSSPVLHIQTDFLEILWYLTASTTILSALSYVFSKKTYHLLKNIKKSRPN